MTRDQACKAGTGRPRASQPNIAKNIAKKYD